MANECERAEKTLPALSRLKQGFNSPRERQRNIQHLKSLGNSPKLSHKLVEWDSVCSGFNLLVFDRSKEFTAERRH